MRYIALLPAAGSGTRMESATPKQYLDLRGKPIIWHTLRALSAVPAIAQTYVVLAKGDSYWERFDWSEFKQLTVLWCGGESRAESVHHGLNAMNEADDTWVLVHDAVRPCLDPRLVGGMITELTHDPVGGILALPVTNTLKYADGDQIIRTHPRNGLWEGQTPQMFRRAQLYKAIGTHLGSDITDEASALEADGQFPRLLLGSPFNLKVTYPQDLELAALILGTLKYAHPHA